MHDWQDELQSDRLDAYKEDLALWFKDVLNANIKASSFLSDIGTPIAGLARLAYGSTPG